MELAGFTPRERGDSWPAKEAVDKPLVVLVREHRAGVVTKFKPEGGEAVVVDAVDIDTDEVHVDTMWMNGAIVDNLAPYVGQAVPIKLAWQASSKGGNAYIGVAALEGAELAKAQAWAQANPSRFDTERAQRNSGGQQQTASTAPAPAAPAAAAPAPTPAPAAPAAPAPVQAADPNDPAVAALLAQINAGVAPPAV